MKKVLTILILSPFALFGQLIDELPMDENGSLAFSEVIQVDGVVKDELYFRSKDFFCKCIQIGKRCYTT
jgi:hypothetical protein